MYEINFELGNVSHEVILLTYFKRILQTQLE